MFLVLVIYTFCDLLYVEICFRSRMGPHPSAWCAVLVLGRFSMELHGHGLRPMIRGEPRCPSYRT